MPLHKVQDLTIRQLNWAAGMCFGMDVTKAPDPRTALEWNPATDWAQGGPIIERESILLRPIRRHGHSMDGHWLAVMDHGNTGTIVRWVKNEEWRQHYWQGVTPLIAAMRCYVASKLGNWVEVPNELVS